MNRILLLKERYKKIAKKSDTVKKVIEEEIEPETYDILNSRTDSIEQLAEAEAQNTKDEQDFIDSNL